MTSATRTALVRALCIGVSLGCITWTTGSVNLVELNHRLAAYAAAGAAYSADGSTDFNAWRGSA
jgi:hypothetical protein